MTNTKQGHTATKRVTCVTDSGEHFGLTIPQANAAFIVKAVNSHELLVEACKEAIKWLQYGQNPNKHRASTILEEALKQAEGE